MIASKPKNLTFISDMNMNYRVAIYERVPIVRLLVRWRVNNYCVEGILIWDPRYLFLLADLSPLTRRADCATRKYIQKTRTI